MSVPHGGFLRVTWILIFSLPPEYTDFTRDPFSAECQRLSKCAESPLLTAVLPVCRSGSSGREGSGIAGCWGRREGTPSQVAWKEIQEATWTHSHRKARRAPAVSSGNFVYVGQTSTAVQLGNQNVSTAPGTLTLPENLQMSVPGRFYQQLLLLESTVTLPRCVVAECKGDARWPQEEWLLSHLL